MRHSFLRDCGLRLVFLLGLAVIVLSPLEAVADPVEIRAAPQSGNARVVFNWPAPVFYEASVDGDVIRLTFGRTIEADLGIVSRSIGDFVDAARIMEDAQSVELRLTSANFDVVHFPAGTAIVIDLIPTESASGPEGETPPASEPENEPAVTEPAASALAQADQVPLPAGAPRVGTRTGRHADKLRLVFDWETDVPYRLSRQDGVTVISFGTPADIDTGPLATSLPSLIGGARSRVTANGSVVELSIPDSARINHFKAGTKVVADIFFPDDGATAGPLPAASAGEASAPAPEPVTEAAATEPEPESAPEIDSEVATPVENESPTALQATETTIAAENETAALETGEQSADQSGEPGETTDASAAVTPTLPQAAAGGGAVPVVAGPRGDGEPGFTLAFDWNDPVGAAVFRRGGALWLVFDQFTPVDIDRIRQAAGPNLVDIVQLRNDNATVLRMVTGRGINPIARREGLTWLIDFKQQGLSTLAPIQATPQLDSPVGSRVFLPVPEPGKAVVITDPEIGDNFIVVPVIPLGYGVTHLYQYPQFRVRPSSQGAVIEPRIDTLRVRPLREGIEVTSTRTLHISPVSATELAKAGVDDDRPLSRIVDMEPLRNVELEFFVEKRRALESDVANARSPTELQKARLELARYYLALGFGSEALGVLRIRGEEDEASRNQPAQRLYTAMSLFILGRYEDAVAELEDDVFRSNDEGVFWRSVSGFAGSDLSGEVLRGLRATVGIPDPYPDALRIPLSLWALEGTLQVGDTPAAEKLIEAIRAEDLTPEQENKVKFLAARAARINGDDEIAIGLFEQAAVGPDRPTAARAAVKRTEMLLELGRLEPAAAAAELEELRYAWRGGEFEFDLLRRLGTLYLRSGQFRDGLNTLRQAATYFRSHPLAPRVTETMVEAFNALFLEGIADKMPPVTAIAIYDEFKELTPPGRLGDRMIQNLADRLASVDLFDSAAELLDAQIKFRLAGPERARVGARLALIHLLNREYERALAALDQSEDIGISEDLSRQRRQLRARAMIGMGDDIAALALIEEDEDLPAEQLRAEVYWDRQDWREASKSFRNIIDLVGIDQSQPLSERDSLYVLNYVIALTLDGNERAVARVNRDYGSAMAQTELAEPFKLIATPETFGAIDIGQVADKVEEAEDFGAFLASYKERLATSGLSAIN